MLTTFTSLQYVIILFGSLNMLGQASTSTSDTLQAKQIYKLMIEQANAAPLDTTFKRAHHLLHTIGDLKKSNENYKVLNSTRGNIWVILLKAHGLISEVDSVKYYSTLIEKNINDPNVLGDAYHAMGRLELNNLNTEKGLLLMNKALDNYRQTGNEDKLSFVLIELVNFYLESEATEEAKTIMFVLNSTIENELSPKTKFLFGILTSRFLMLENKKQRSLNYILKLDTTIFKTQTNFRKVYFEQLSKTSNEIGNYDSSIYYINKAFPAEKNQKNKHDALLKNTILAESYYLKKDYSKALFYLQETEKIEGTEILIKLDNLKLKYLIYKASGDFVKATEKVAEYLQLRDSLSLRRAKKQSSILIYNIKKDQELKKLERLDIEQQYALKQEKQQLLFAALGLLIILLTLGLSVYFYLRQRNLKTNMALNSARETSQLKDKFIENISHEFRTPIAVIIGYLELIIKSTLRPKDIVSYAKICIKNGNELTAALNNFPAVLKSESQSNIIDIQDKNMRKFNFDTVKCLAVESQLHNIQLYFKSNLRDNCADISFNYDKLEKVLKNLLTNAVKFSKMNSSIYVTANLENGFLNLIVEDEGIGISEKEQGKVFDQFFQSKEHAMQGGLGIGLSLIKELITDWHGEITFKSKEGVGTIFNVHIPLKLEHTEMYINQDYCEFEAIKIETEDITEEKKTGNLPRALIIEDNNFMSLLIVKMLSSIVTSTIAHNGREGLSKLKEGKFDIIISDLRMPVMDGFEFKAALNKLEDYRDIPFLMLSSSPMQEKMKERVALGIKEYILKPFHNIEIIARVQLLLKTNINKENLFNLEDDIIDFQGDSYELMSQINSIINENLKNPDFNVEQLSQLCNFSKSKLYKTIQPKTGLSPVKIILEVRLLKAYELIKTQKFETLNEVMQEVGINSGSYFRKVFTERFGTSPSEVLKKIKGIAGDRS
jgi:signal transduction histidine kinase/DNA-binding response OmpR family regulator